jgi:hypothetical protein
VTDIVERLQRKVFRGPTMEAVHIKTLEWEAADEIARLRAENERLRAALKQINVGEGWAALTARAALSGDKQ